MDPAELSEKLGYQVAAKPAPAPAAAPKLDPLGAQISNRADPAAQALLAEAAQTLGAAQREAFQPVAERLQALLDGSETELQSGLDRLRAELPALAKRVGASPETLAAWEKLLGSALLDGLTGGSGGASPSNAANR